MCARVSVCVFVCFISVHACTCVLSKDEFEGLDSM
jgi:hypothetical protein